MNRHLLVYLLATMALLASQTSLRGQCLALKQQHSPSTMQFNPDSLLIDTCSTDKALYARLTFLMRLTISPLASYAAADGDGFYDIEDLDTTQSDYGIWDSLATANGGIKFRREFPDNSDSTSYANRSYELCFGSYVHVDSVESVIRSTSNCEYVLYRNRSAKMLGIPSEPGILPKTAVDEIGNFIGTTSSYSNKRKYEHGWLQGYYELDLPMAWEITKGKNSVYVAVSDVFDRTAGPIESHQDLSSTPAGNFYFQDSKHSGSIILRNLYDDNHGYAILHQVAGQENSVGLIGVAPKVRVAAVVMYSDCSQLDLESASGIQVPHVVNCSFFAAGRTANDAYFNAMNAGVSLVGTLDNVRQDFTTFTNEYGLTEPFETHVEGSETIDKAMTLPKLDRPGSNTYLDPSFPTDPKKDVRVLCVMGYENNTTSQLGQCYSPLSSEVTIPEDANFSIGIKKFSTNTNSSERLAEKEAAAIDVIAPRNLIRAAYSGGSAYKDGNAGNSFTIPHVSGVIGLMMSVHDRLGLQGLDVHRRVYDIVTFTADKIQDPGLSRSVEDVMDITQPHSSRSGTTRTYGIPNILFSLNYPDLLKTVGGEKYLKTELQQVANDPLSRYWGIRVGFGRVNAFRCLAHSIPDKNTAGEVNVKYQYSGSDALDWSRGHSLEGTTFLHLGKFKNATEMVLAKGGHVYTGEPAYRNNNGKTLVDVDLSVGSNQALVVDGILTTSLTSNYKKISTSSTGRILITGWVENVSLEGQIRATDLRIKKTGTGEVIRCTGNSELYDTTWVSGGSNFVVASGTLTMQPGSILYLDGTSKLVIKAGAELKMSHGSKIIDKRTNKAVNCVSLEAKTSTLAGGKLTVLSETEGAVIDAEVQVNDEAEFFVGGVDVTTAQESSIPSVTLRKVTVEVGGKFSTANKAHVRAVSGVTSNILTLKSTSGLTIDVGATVRLDIPVEVQSGSKIEVKSSALAQIGAITVQSNGSLIVKAGGTLQFLAETNTVRGKLIGEGESTNKAVFKATNEESNCSGQPARVSYARLYVEPDVWIYNTTTPGTQPLEEVLTAYFHAQEAEFTNVYTTIRNMPVLAKVGGVLQAGKMKNCTFKADRSDYVAAGIEAAFRDKTFFLVDVYKDSRLFQKARQMSGNVPGTIYQQGLGLIRKLTVEGCYFHDAGGKITSTNYRALEQKSPENDKGDYPVSGLKVTSLSLITVTGSTFAFLHTGVKTGYVRGYFSGNIFGGHADGIACGSATICNNKFSGCVQGVRVTEGGNQVFDNTFGGTMTSTTNTLFGSGVQVDYIGSGYLQSLGGNAECRNNELENYGTGLHAVSGLLQARDRFAFLAPNQNDRGKALVNGRNEFNVPVTGGTNPYFAGIERSDIFLGAKGKVLLECGKNVFNANPGFFHLQKSDIEDDVVVTTNNFGVDLESQIRHNAFIDPEGIDLRNGEHPYEGQCEANIRARAGEFECVTLPVPNPNAFTPYYNLELLHPLNVKKFGIVVPSWDDIDENYAKEIFTVSTSWLANAGLDVAIRMESIDNAVQSAQVHPQVDSVTAVLLATLQTLGLDTAAPLVVREKAVMGRVELLSRNERYNEAQSWLDTARVGMFAGYDSVNVDLLSARLAIMADTTLTLMRSTDTLNALVTLETEHAKRPTGMNKEPIQKMVRAGGGDVSFVVYPNPSRDHLTIRYEGKRMGAVTVRILDMLGAELLRHLKSGVTFGEEIVITDTDLPNGTYLVEVSDGTSAGTAVISVVR